MIDDVLLPENWSKGSTGGPEFHTLAVAVASGAVDREERWEHPLWRYDIAQNVKSPEDIAWLRSFHLARRGASRAFLLKDWIDYTSATSGIGAPAVADQSLGTGDGATTVFNLIKRYADNVAPYDRPILWPEAGTVVVAKNGTTLVSGFTVQRGAGTVTFSVAPAAAAVLTAGFRFNVPVRFAEDLLSISWDSVNSRSIGSVPLEEVRE